MKIYSLFWDGTNNGVPFWGRVEFADQESAEIFAHNVVLAFKYSTVEKLEFGSVHVTEAESVYIDDLPEGAL